MSKYFRYFPQTVHSERVVVDITKRIRFFETVAANPFVFLPYTVKEGQRVDDLAHFYYGSVDYVWLIYLANNIIDPYYDWPMSQRDLENYIIREYADAANTTGRYVLEWSKNTLTSDNILYYENNEGEKISPETYGLASSLDLDFTSSEWSPIRVYDYEFERNEKKRNIQVVDKIYAEQINRDMKQVLDF